MYRFSFIIFLIIAGPLMGAPVMDCSDEILNLIRGHSLENPIRELHDLHQKISKESDGAVQALVEKAVVESHQKINQTLGQNLPLETLLTLGSRFVKPDSTSTPSLPSDETIHLPPFDGGSFQNRHHPDTSKAVIPSEPILKKVAEFDLIYSFPNIPTWSAQNQIAVTLRNKELLIFKYDPRKKTLKEENRTWLRSETQGGSWGPGNTLAVGDTYGVTILNGNHPVGQESQNIYGGQLRAHLPSWGPGGVVAESNPGYAYKFHLHSPRGLLPLPNDRYLPTASAVDPAPNWNSDGFFAFGTKQGDLVVGDIDNNRARKVASSGKMMDSSLIQPSWGENGLLAWGGNYGDFRLYHFDNEKRKLKALMPLGGTFGKMEYSPVWNSNGKVAALLTTEKDNLMDAIEVADIDPSGNVLSIAQTNFEKEKKLSGSLSWGPDNLLAATTRNGTVLILKSDKPFQALTQIAEYSVGVPIQEGVSWGPDGTLALTTQNGKLLLLQLQEKNAWDRTKEYFYQRFRGGQP